MNRQRNILMIAVDCLRSDRIFGDGRVCPTPHLDQLVARGVSLPNMYVENSITAPAFTTLMTGCYSLAHGVTGLLGVRMNEQMYTLADALVANGYHTYAEVTGPLLPMVGLDQGFDEYHFRDQNEYFFTEWGDRLLARMRERRDLAEPWFMLVHFWEMHEPRQVRPEFDKPEFGASSYDRALAGLDEYIGRLLDAAGPDTIIVFTGDHGERVDEVTAPGTLLPYFMEKLGIPCLQDEADTRVAEDVDLMTARGTELNEVTQGLMAASATGDGRISWGKRLGMLANLIKVGLTRMRTQKRKPGWRGFVELLRMKWDDFLIGWAVATGDSKDAQVRLLRTTLSQFHLQHGYHIYDYLARVPFVIAGADGLESARVVRTDVRNIDVMPTLCDLLKLDMPAPQWHGVSFLPAIREGVSDNRPLYMEARGGAQAVHAFYIRGVRSGGQKLAFAPHDERAPVELYDLSGNGGGENENLCDAMPEVVLRLREEAETLAATLADGSGTELSAEQQKMMVEKLKSLGYM